MKVLRTLAVVIALAASLAALPALGATSVLTPDGVRYAIEMAPDQTQIVILRAEDHLRARLVVPSTHDANSESQAQLSYDPVTGTLFVAYVVDNYGNAEIRFTRLDSYGSWAPTRMVAAGSSLYRGLQFALTHAETETGVATFAHLSWWSINGPSQEPEYALVAFENGQFVSADVENLESLANGVQAVVSASDWEDVGDVLHPPMAMAREKDSVSLAWGASGSTSLTRMKISPRRIAGDARIWTPVGRSITQTPRAGLTSLTSAPVEAFIVKGRLALYVTDEVFRYVVLGTDGEWSAPQSVSLDAENTLDDLLRDLRASVEELLDREAKPDELSTTFK